MRTTPYPIRLGAQIDQKVATVATKARISKAQTIRMAMEIGLEIIERKQREETLPVQTNDQQ